MKIREKRDSIPDAFSSTDSCKDLGSDSSENVCVEAVGSYTQGMKEVLAEQEIQNNNLSRLP